MYYLGFISTITQSPLYYAQSLYWLLIMPRCACATVVGLCVILYVFNSIFSEVTIKLGAGKYSMGTARQYLELIVLDF